VYSCTLHAKNICHTVSIIKEVNLIKWFHACCYVVNMFCIPYLAILRIFLNLASYSFQRCCLKGFTALPNVQANGPCNKSEWYRQLFSAVEDVGISMESALYYYDHTLQKYNTVHLHVSRLIAACKAENLQ